jgi:hypothetical protein
MNAIELKDLKVGQTYYIHQVKDEDTHEPVSFKYKAVCKMDFSMPGGWYDFGFDSLKGINTSDIDGGFGISIEENRWSLYKFYLCESDAIVERVTINAALKCITGDEYFRFY